MSNHIQRKSRWLEYRMITVVSTHYRKAYKWLYQPHNADLGIANDGDADRLL